MKDSRPTRVCLLTPPGRSAVAVLAVAGPQAIVVVDSQFCPAMRSQRLLRGRATGDWSLGAQGAGRIFFGRWGGPQGEEVVVCRRQFPHAGAHHAGAQHGESQYVEVHCHGGRQAAHRILNALIAKGCQTLPWQAWTRQQTGDLLHSEALIDLATAQTQRTAAILLDQCQGALRREIVALKGEIAACRDNPAGHISTPGRKIETLLAHADTGRHLTWPWQVLLAGRPNVGKSSLVNALLGYERAIVFDQPGTTRDILSATTAMQGWPVQLSDTVGMHETSDPLELEGIQLAREQLSQADLLLWVLDAALLGKTALEGSHEEILRIAQQELAGVKRDFPARLRVLYVLNKIDVVRHQGDRRGHTPWNAAETPSVLGTSAITGEGVESLVSAIAACLVPCPPTPGDAVPFNDRQQRLLLHADDQLQQANFKQAIAALDELLA